MNIRIKADKAHHLDKICKEMKMNPSQLMEYFLDTIQHLYYDYERAEVEKESFREILTNLFFSYHEISPGKVILPTYREI